MVVATNGQLIRLYVLVDAAGFTCACDATSQGVMRSKLCHGLVAPIIAYDWVRTSEPTMHGGWKKVGESVWP